MVSTSGTQTLNQAHSSIRREHAKTNKRSPATFTSMSRMEATNKMKTYLQYCTSSGSPYTQLSTHLYRFWIHRPTIQKRRTL